MLSLHPLLVSWGCARCLPRGNSHEGPEESACSCPGFHPLHQVFPRSPKECQGLGCHEEGGRWGRCPHGASPPVEKLRLDSGEVERLCGWGEPE